jgi:Holliday junction resolvase
LERKLQSEIIKYLKSKGAYVIKTRPQPGTPSGCPDIIALYRGRYTALEVKADEKSPNRPGQLETLLLLSEHNDFVYRVHPDNWPDVRAELENKFFQSAYGQ